jgi:hypothetical protein
LRDCEWYVSGGWNETWPGPGMPGEADYWTEGWPPVENVPIGQFLQAMPFQIGCIVTNWNGGWDGYYTDEVCESVTVRYVTGRATPGKVRLHRLNYGATDRETWNPIPPGSITALGRTPDTNGNIFQAWADDMSVDATPTVSGHNAWEFVILPRHASLELKDQLTGQYITDKTNVAWVGEKIDLLCRLSEQIGTITNFQWTVPGKRFQDYVITSTNSFLTSVSLTQSTVNFFWTHGLPHEVTCTAKVQGQTLTAKTYFIVHKPEAQLWFKKRASVAVTTNVFAGQGAYWLTTGNAYTSDFPDPNQLTDVGMLIEFRIDDLKGFTNAFAASYVQVVTVDWKYNIQGETNHWWAKGKALDGRFPYEQFGDFAWYGHTRDTPRHALGVGARFQEFLWRKDDFVGVLMWQAKRGIPSVPVPLKIGQWNWYGRARLTSTNGIPWRYEGVPPYIEPANYTGMNWEIPLTWTNVYPTANHVDWHLGYGKLPTP